MASSYLVLILLPCWLCRATLLPNLAGNVLLRRLESPYDAPGDILIPYGSTVTVESGTTLRFPRGAQLIVRGTLLAKVRSSFLSSVSTTTVCSIRVHLIDALSSPVRRARSTMINSKCIERPDRTFDFVSSTGRASRTACFRCTSRTVGDTSVQNSFGRTIHCSC